ncbi:hypothetical protein QUA35_08185 [Microcoleus sp. N9_B2]|uniref:hypothetical protein n=2 Tax=unclassified Microcoleus TaxID=2642155 RepID=UPI002FD69C09
MRDADNEFEPDAWWRIDAGGRSKIRDDDYVRSPLVESSQCLVFGARGDRLGAVICYTDNCRLTKLRTMKTYSFDAIIELVEEMSDDEQITLIDLIGRRLKEKRRDEIALNIVRADEEYLHEQVFRGTVNDIMAELKR